MFSQSQTPMEAYASQEEIMKSFGQTLYELMYALSEVFPECNETKTMFITVKNMYDKYSILKSVIETWHSDLSKFYENCKNGDVEPILNSNINIIEKLKIKDKWYDPQFGVVSQNHLLDYINLLNSFANDYFEYEQQQEILEPLKQVVPESVFNRVMDAASEIQNGRGGNVLQIAQSLLSELNESDIEQLEQNKFKICDIVQPMALLPHMTQASKENGMPDLVKMLGMVSSMGSSSVITEDS